jgi:hypothetical protein
MIRLVRTQGFGGRADVQMCMLIQLPQSYDRLGFGNWIMQGEIRAQTVAIFHQNVAAKAQLGFFAFGFAIEHALGVGRALVRVVAALFAMKVDRGVAGVIVLGGLDFLLIPAVLADETFQAGPGLDQRAIDGEVVITGPAFLPRNVIDLGEEQFGDLGGKDPLIVLR